MERDGLDAIFVPPHQGGDASESQPAPANHRVRVGRERRQKTRAHLLCAVLQVCSNESARSPAVIDDVAGYADVSRGTFYKYFDSLDQAIAELGNQLAEEMMRESPGSTMP